MSGLVGCRTRNNRVPYALLTPTAPAAFPKKDIGIRALGPALSVRDGTMPRLNRISSSAETLHAKVASSIRFANLLSEPSVNPTK